MKKIVITGGPCAGKTTALSIIRKTYEEKGYTVIIVPETATELLFGGVAIDSMETRLFQKTLLKLQLHKEECFLKAASDMNCEKIVMFFDRGAIDGKGYMKDDEFLQNLDELSLKEDELFDRYDAVICLETAAKAPGNLYQTENNFVRFESQEEALSVDKRLYEVWHTHKNFKLIHADSDFDKKINSLMDTIEMILN